MTQNTLGIVQKKVQDEADLIIEMTDQLTSLQSIIEGMDEKRGSIFISWLRTQNKYLVFEETFDPSYLRAYKRSEIVMANFGFNVGAEYGGMHYAVVVRDSSKKNPNVNVVPLSSLDEGETEDDVHRDRVLLGIIEGLNDKQAVAIPDQMQSISKIRIYKPKKRADNVFKLTSEQMDLLDDKIRRLYTKL